jgi:hypothetical protein
MTAYAAPSATEGRGIGCLAIKINERQRSNLDFSTQLWSQNLSNLLTNFALVVGICTHTVCDCRRRLCRRAVVAVGGGDAPMHQHELRWRCSKLSMCRGLSTVTYHADGNVTITCVEGDGLQALATGTLVVGILRRCRSALLPQWQRAVTSALRPAHAARVEDGGKTCRKLLLRRKTANSFF